MKTEQPTLKITKRCYASIDIKDGLAEQVFEAMLGKSLPKEARLVAVEENNNYDVYGYTASVSRSMKFEWTEVEEL